MPSAVSGCGCEESVVLLRELFEVGSGVPFRDLVARSSRQQRLLWDWERVTVLAFDSGGSRGARPALPLADSAAARHGRGLVRMFLLQPDLSHLVLLVTHLCPFPSLQLQLGRGCRGARRVSLAAAVVSILHRVHRTHGETQRYQIRAQCSGLYALCVCVCGVGEGDPDIWR